MIFNESQEGTPQYNEELVARVENALLKVIDLEAEVRRLQEDVRQLKLQMLEVLCLRSR